MVDAAVTICSPMRMVYCNETLKASYNGVFYKHFGLKLRAVFFNNKRVLKDYYKEKHQIDLEKYVMEKYEVPHYNLLVALQHGYIDEKDYYERSSMVHIVH